MPGQYQTTVTRNRNRIHISFVFSPCCQTSWHINWAFPKALHILKMPFLSSLSIAYLVESSLHLLISARRVQGSVQFSDSTFFITPFNMYKANQISIPPLFWA